MLSDDIEIMTVEEACEVLKIGHNAIYRLLNSGKLRAFRNGRHWRIPREAVRQYILENAKLK